MHIEEKKITVREVTEGYFNDAEEGVVGYDEQLVDYSMFLKKRICGGKRCCLEPVLSHCDERSAA